jgi:hypothetical protein
MAEKNWHDIAGKKLLAVKLGAWNVPHSFHSPLGLRPRDMSFEVQLV